MRSRSADPRRLSYPSTQRLMRVIQAELDSMAGTIPVKRRETPASPGSVRAFLAVARG